MEKNFREILKVESNQQLRVDLVKERQHLRAKMVDQNLKCLKLWKKWRELFKPDVIRSLFTFTGYHSSVSKFSSLRQKPSLKSNANFFFPPISCEKSWQSTQKNFSKKFLFIERMITSSFFLTKVGGSRSHTLSSFQLLKGDIVKLLRLNFEIF